MKRFFRVTYTDASAQAEFGARFDFPGHARLWAILAILLHLKREHSPVPEDTIWAVTHLPEQVTEPIIWTCPHCELSDLEL